MKIYLSPHSDDVALSCGGQIIADPRAEDDVLVVNIFTSEGEDSAHSGLFDQVNSDRTREDRAAWDSIGVRCEFANLPEALLRGEFPFRVLRGGQHGEVVQSICDILEPVIADHPGATFFFPAGIGSHVDHLACRDSAFRLLDERRLERVMLYEDVPYSWLRFIRKQHYKALERTIDFDDGSEALRRDGMSLRNYLREAAVPFPRGKKLFPIVQTSLLCSNVLAKGGASRPYRGVIRSTALSDAQVRKKQALIFHYASQLQMLFGAEPDRTLRAVRESFAKEVSIEVTRR